MTTTYLVTDGTTGTQRVEADDELEALAVAARYIDSTRTWRVVGIVPPPSPYTPPVYHPELVEQKDPLEGEG